MIPHFQSQRKLPCLPLCPLVLPLQICSQDQLLCEKMKINNEGKVREGMRICLLTWQKKRHKKNLIRAAATVIQCCVLRPSICHKPFSEIIRGAPTSTAQFITRAATIIEFLCFGICIEGVWSPNFIPHVKSHYSSCFPLIDSSFLHFISRLCAQGFISRLPSCLFWGSLYRTVKRARWVKICTGELERERFLLPLHVCVHSPHFFLNQNVRINW